MRWMGAASAMAASAAEGRARLCAALAPRAATAIRSMQPLRSQSAQKVAMRLMHMRVMGRGAATPGAVSALLQMRSPRCTQKPLVTAPFSGMPLMGNFALRRIVPAMTSAAGQRSLSTQAAAEDTRDAYQVMEVPRTISAEDLKIQYKELARKWHPDRHQGQARAEAELRFQLISEAFQTLNDPKKRADYDHALEVAKDGVELANAARRYRATSWNTPVDDISQRVRSAKREEPESSSHFMAVTLFLITGNFILAFYWLAG